MSIFYLFIILTPTETQNSMVAVNIIVAPEGILKKNDMKSPSDIDIKLAKKVDTQNPEKDFESWLPVAGGIIKARNEDDAEHLTRERWRRRERCRVSRYAPKFLFRKSARCLSSELYRRAFR